MYELKRGDVEDLMRFIGEPTREKGEELEARLCPFCKGGRNKDTYTFSINRVSGAYTCLRSSCGAKGWFVQLARQVGYRIEDEEAPRTYRKQRQPVGSERLSEKCAAYLEGRGISRKTAERYGLYSWVNGDSEGLVFPFWDAEHREVVTLKVRNIGWHRGDGGAKEKFAQQDTRPILFGMDRCTDRGTLVITEGQLDSLSLAEAGIPNAVSVPNGSKAFTWLRWCKEFVESFEKVVVFGDMERTGMTLIREISDRVKVQVFGVRKVDYLECKDANEILCAFGPEELRTAVANAEPYKTRHLVDLSEVVPQDPNDLPRTRTRIYELDRAIGGLIQGQIVVLTGRRGEGKSTFASSLIKDAVDQGKRVFVYSGELSEAHFKTWLDRQIAGQARGEAMPNEFGDMVLKIQKDTDEMLRLWYKGKIFLYRDGDEGDHTDPITAAEEAVRELGCELVVIDNLMTALTVDSQNDLLLAQSNFVGRLKQLATVYGTCILLLAHPRKMGKAEKDKEIEADDISGSGDITNRVDTVLAYQRGTDGKSGAVSVIKNRLYGKLKQYDDKIMVAYDPLSMRVTGKTDHDAAEAGRDYLKGIEISDEYVRKYVFEEDDT